MKVRIFRSEPMIIWIMDGDRIEELNTYLRRHYRERNVNVALSTWGNTVFYVAKWGVHSKKHKLICVDSLTDINLSLRSAETKKQTNYIVRNV